VKESTAQIVLVVFCVFRWPRLQNC